MYKNNYKLGFKIGINEGECTIKGVADSKPESISYIIQIDKKINGSRNHHYDCMVCPESSLFELN